MKTEFNVDAHFVIGKMHHEQNKPCQDHTLAAMYQGVGLLSVSDGCSSGGNTDIGSRIITCAAMMTLREYIDYGTSNVLHLSTPIIIDTKIKNRINHSRSLLGLQSRDMYATCLYAIVTQEGGFVHLLGDGHIVLQYHDGAIVIYSTHWNNNEPFYPAYKSEGLDHFINDHLIIDKGLRSLTIQETKILSDGVITSSKQTKSTQEGIEGFSIFLSEEDIVNKIKCLAIVSDGLDSFHGPLSKVEALSVIPHLLAFKSWKGDFVKRRLSRFLTDSAKQNIFPGDDLSYAVLHVNTIT